MHTYMLRRAKPRKSKLYAVKKSVLQYETRNNDIFSVIYGAKA